MLDDFVFKPHSVTLDNLTELCRDQSIIEERRILEISDLADAAALLSQELSAMGLGAAEMLAVIADDLSFGDVAVHGERLDENAARIASSLSAVDGNCREVFCELYLKRMAELGLPIAEADLLPVAVLGESLGYVRNALADEAYYVFSDSFTDPRVRYYRDFRECAAAVADGEIDFGILPLEERGGSRINAVEELVYKHDLKLNSVTPVFGPDGTADVKYALVSRGFIISPASRDDDRYFEIRIPVGGAEKIGAIFSAASHYGLETYRVNTLNYGDGQLRESFLSVVFRDCRDGFAAFIAYLSLFVLDYAPVGMYKNLE